MECPNENWVDTFVENSNFSKYHVTAEKEEVVNYIIHFTPDEVLDNQKYKEWMNKFGPKTQHLIVNEKNSGYTSEAIHKMQIQLNLIHNKIFPILPKLFEEVSILQIFVNTLICI